MKKVFGLFALTATCAVAAASLSSCGTSSDKIGFIFLHDENSSYEISGNENLKNGSVIYITVTAPDTSNTVYTINISVKKANMFVILYLIIPVGLIYLGYKYKDSIVKLLKKKKLIEDLTLDELLTRYNLNYKDKGLTKFFDKLSEVDKRTILMDSLKNRPSSKVFPLT